MTLNELPCIKKEEAWQQTMVENIAEEKKNHKNT